MTTLPPLTGHYRHVANISAMLQASEAQGGKKRIPFTAETTAPLPGRPIPAQWEMINSDARALAVDCSRQCGKTCGVVKRTAKRSWEMPGRRTLYINHTLGNAKRQFFDPPGDAAPLGLLGTLDAHGIEYAANKTEVFVELENGSFVQAIGCDDMGAVKTKLGFFWHDVIIDEIQEYPEELLDLLIRRALAPTLIKTRGTLLLGGTPSPILDGFWYSIYKECIALGDKGAYKRFHWTMLDNPVITRESIVEQMAKAGFTVDFEHPEKNHPIVQREVFGMWVEDLSALVYEYLPGRNDLPADWRYDPASGLWRFSMGIDVGGVTEANDKDAIVMLGWRVDDPAHHIDEMESWSGRGDSEVFCDKVVEVYERWSPSAVCMDTGGGGNKALATIQKRIKGMPVTGKPTNVDLSQRLVNDELRSGRMRFRVGSELVAGAKRCLKGKHEQDIMAACRYAHHGAYHFHGEAPPPPETDEDRRVREWLERQAAQADPYNPYGN